MKRTDDVAQCKGTGLNLHYHTHKRNRSYLKSGLKRASWSLNSYLLALFFLLPLKIWVFCRYPLILQFFFSVWCVITPVFLSYFPLFITALPFKTFCSPLILVDVDACVHICTCMRVLLTTLNTCIIRGTNMALFPEARLNVLYLCFTISIHESSIAFQPLLCLWKTILEENPVGCPICQQMK